MGIKNIAIVKQSLMAKNLFKYLNKHGPIWVDILYMKYGVINFWTHSAPTGYSAFFQLLELHYFHCQTSYLDQLCQSYHHIGYVPSLDV